MIQIIQQTGGFVCISALLTGLILLPVLMRFRRDNDTLPCGHSKDSVRGDVTKWCAECEAKNEGE